MLSLIFDADGTLFDSYSSIVDRINRTLLHFDIHFNKDQIRDYLIKTSSLDFLYYVSDKYKLPKEEILNEYNSLKSNLDIIEFMPQVKETLKFLHKKVKLFIYTHRGESLDVILNNLKIKDVFLDTITSSYGFKRKPSGEALTYLVKKYHLDINDTYYVGDREIDILSAKDAGIKSVFYNSSNININCKPTIEIKDFGELLSLFNIK